MQALREGPGGEQSRMTAIALLIAANIASNAPDRRADAHLYDIQLDILRRGFAPEGLTIEPVRWMEPARRLEAVRGGDGQLRVGLSGQARGIFSQRWTS